MSGITVVIPSIPERVENGMLRRALKSVAAQTLLPDNVIVADANGQSADATRDDAITFERIKTPWLAFLDDDDEFLYTHLESLMRFAIEHDADYVYPWFIVEGGTDPWPERFGRPWDDAEPICTTITTLVRTDLYYASGGFLFQEGDNDRGPDDAGNRAYEDERFTLRCIKAGAKIMHLPQRTWVWHHHGHNTMGLPSRITPHPRLKG